MNKTSFMKRGKYPNLAKSGTSQSILKDDQPKHDLYVSFQKSPEKSYFGKPRSPFHAIFKIQNGFVPLMTFFVLL